jgi:predicted Fe-Mo cluster-binding NifX family protein
VTGNVGPNAFQVLQPAGVPIYLFGGGTVRQAVEAYKAGELPTTGGASGPAHAGIGRSAAPTPAASTSAREEEIAMLRETARELRRQIAEVTERLDRLEGR